MKKLITLLLILCQLSYGGITISGGGGGGSGTLTSINADSTEDQTLTTGTSGSDFAIVDNGSGDHKFNLPTASGSARGALSSADWTNFNSKLSAAITSINSQTGASQTLAVGTSGSDFAVSTSSNTHTFNLPDAGASARGVVTTGTQTIAGTKTFSTAPILSSLSTQAMPYLNSSKQFANGGWTQADSTFATVFTPTGSPSIGLNIDLSSLTAYSTAGFNINAGTVPSSAAVTLSRINATGTTSSNALTGHRVTFNNGSYSGAQVRGNDVFINVSNNATALTPASSGGGNVGYFSLVGASNPGAGYGGVFTTVNGNLQVGVEGYAYQSGGGSSPQNYGGRFIATQANSAQAVGVYGRIYTTDGSTAEGANPGINAGGAFDNGNTTGYAFAALNNGTLKLLTKSNGDSAVVATQKIASFTAKGGPDLSNIGGTTTANTTTTITGSGTTYLEHLSELDRISVSSSAANYRHVKTIASNTSLTVEENLGNGTSQTINRKRAIQTWRDASDNFVGGIADYGHHLIGSPNAGVYFSNKIAGALTVNNSFSAAMIAAFYENGSWVSHVNVGGFYKHVYGSNTDGEQKPTYGNPVCGNSGRVTTNGGGGDEELGSCSIATSSMLNGDAPKLKITAYGNARNATGTFKLVMDGLNLCTWNIDIGVTKWNIDATVANDPGSAGVA